jgi:DNA-binding CsgD family transcriptional regulator
LRARLAVPACAAPAPDRPPQQATADWRSAANGVRSLRNAAIDAIPRPRWRVLAVVDPAKPVPGSGGQAAAAGGLAFAIRPRGDLRVQPSRPDHEVVVLGLGSRSNDETGGALGIGTLTVETHLARLHDRVGVPPRTELATRALGEGRLDLRQD